jgi:hypothetical protein
MTVLKYTSAALIAATLLAGPVMAREIHRNSRHFSSYTLDEPYRDGKVCHPAPRIAAFATQPWDSGDVPCEPTAGY